MGATNIKYFLLFLLYVWVGCVYWLSLLFWHAEAARYDTPILWWVAVVCCIAFFIFVSGIWTNQVGATPLSAPACPRRALVESAHFPVPFHSQYNSIITATPLIDAMKVARRRAMEKKRRELAANTGLPSSEFMDEDEETEEEWVKRRKNLALVAGLARACGERPSWRWMLPLRPPPEKIIYLARLGGRGLDGCSPEFRLAADGGGRGQPKAD